MGGAELLRIRRYGRMLIMTMRYLMAQGWRNGLMGQKRAHIKQACVKWRLHKLLVSAAKHWGGKQQRRLG